MMVLVKGTWKKAREAFEDGEQAREWMENISTEKRRCVRVPTGC